MKVEPPFKDQNKLQGETYHDVNPCKKCAIEAGTQDRI